MPAPFTLIQPKQPTVVNPPPPLQRYRQKLIKRLFTAIFFLFAIPLATYISMHGSTITLALAIAAAICIFCYTHKIAFQYVSSSYVQAATGFILAILLVQTAPDFSNIFLSSLFYTTATFSAALGSSWLASAIGNAFNEENE